MKVGTLHFLVHPGYELARDEWDKVGMQLSDAQIKNEQELIQRYRDKVDSMGGEDVLVIFSSEGLLYRDCLRQSKQWMQLEGYAREKMGRRCIALSNPQHLGGRGDSNMERVQRILEQRGFETSQDTQVEVWGEKAMGCVARTAHFANEHFKPNEPPVITTQSTDAGKINELGLQVLENQLRQVYPKTRYVNKK